MAVRRGCSIASVSAVIVVIALTIMLLGNLILVPLIGLAASVEVVQASQTVTVLAFAQMIPMADHVTAVAGLRALKDTRSPMYSSLISEYLVFLPLGWYLTRVLRLGLMGVFIDHLVFWLVAVLICMLRLFPLMKKNFGSRAQQATARTQNSTARSESE